MRRPITLLLLVGTALVESAFPLASSAAVFVTVSVEEAARSSDAVLRGKVESMESRMARDGGRIYTLVTIRVESVFKGSPGEIVLVTIPGGRVGSLAQISDAAPRFEEGEEVVVFLSRRGPGWRVTGQALGKYRVDGDTARPAVDMGGALPRPLPAGERAVGPMPLAELERRVRAAR